MFDKGLRKLELQELENACQSGQNVLLIGLPGVGKTLLLEQLKNKDCYSICECDCKDLQKGLNLVNRFIQALPDGLIPPKDDRSFESFSSALLTRTSDCRFVFLLDQFDFSATVPREVVRDLNNLLEFQSEYGSNFSLIIAVRSGTLYAFDADDSESLKLNLQCFYRIFMKPLPKCDAESWLSEKKLGFKKAKRIARLSGGLPRLMDEMFELWKSGEMPQRESKVLSALIRNDKSILLEFWEDFPEKPRFWLCKNFFSVFLKPKVKDVYYTYYKYFEKIGLINEYKEKLDIFCPLLKSYARDTLPGCSLRECLLRDFKFILSESFFWIVVLFMYGSVLMIVLSQLLSSVLLAVLLNLLILFLLCFVMLYFGVFPSMYSELKTLQYFWIATGILFFVLSCVLFGQQNIGFIWNAICSVFSFATAIRLHSE